MERSAAVYAITARACILKTEYKPEYNKAASRIGSEYVEHHLHQDPCEHEVVVVQDPRVYLE